jgi:acetolactate synthase small subunit
MFNPIKALINKFRKNSFNSYQSGWQDQGANFQVDSTAQVLSYSTYLNTPIGTNTSMPFNAIGQNDGQKTEWKADEREIKKPVEIVGEIVSEKPVMVLENIEEQIKIVSRRLKVMKRVKGQTYDEEIALGFLNARRYYRKYEHLFRWSITTNEMIAALCKKYKVRMVDFGSYSKNVPNEALDELEKFAVAWDKVRKDTPVLKLIVDEGGKETKKDPILLMSSPFGRWWYIGGAWDKEVLIVDDLVYNGK